MSEPKVSASKISASKISESKIGALKREEDSPPPLRPGVSPEDAPTWPARWAAMVQRIERVEGKASLAGLMDRLSQPAEPMVLAFVNAHAMNSVASSPAFFHLLAGADTLLRDGSGMATLFKMLGVAPGLNLNGTDLIPELLARFNGRSIAFFGTSEPYLTRGVAAALRLVPASTWAQADGFRANADYEALAELHRPALIVLGMGMPRQEEVAAALRVHLTHPCLIVCGGAIIDFLGGKTPRAPAIVRSAGLEWMWRLTQEPRRLFQRYVIGNPLFIARAWRVARRVRRAVR